MATSFKRSHTHTDTLSAPNPAAASATHASTRDSWALPGKSGSVSCGVAAPFSQVLVHKVLSCPPRGRFPVLYKLWRLYGGVTGDLLQEGLCHTQVCCTQSLCVCRSPLLTCTCSGDTQMQLCLSLCGVSGSWCTQPMFEPSERLWQVWGLSANVKVTIPLQL